MKDIPLGIGNPDDPLYGILDTDQNFFYLVSQYQEVAEKITKLLSQYRSVKVESISDAINYQHKLLDNSVCMNWGIEYNPEKLCMTQSIDHGPETRQLIDNLLTVLVTAEKIHNFRPMLDSLSRSRIGMDLPAETLQKQFANDLWFNTATRKETENYNRVRAAFEQQLSDIESVFELGIFSSDYKNLVNDRMLKLPIDLRFKKFFYEF